MLNCFCLRQISGEKCSVATISCSNCTEMSPGTTNNYNIIVTGVTSQHKKEENPTTQPKLSRRFSRNLRCKFWLGAVSVSPPPYPVRGRDGRRGWRWGPLSSPVVASYRLHIVTTGLSLKCICRQNVTRICHCRLDDHTTSENPQQKLFLHSQPRSSTRSN